ncbi:MAG: DUF222 domain-containing protein [Dermatophilaceae bacterium]
MHSLVEAFDPVLVSVGAPGVDDALIEVHRSIDDLVADHVRPGAEGTVVAEIDRAVTRLQATKLALVARAERTGLARRAGASSTGAWLAGRTRSTGASAAAEVRLAVALESDDLADTRAALAEGMVSAAHASVIATVVSQLPDELDPDQRAAVGARLVRQARHLDPARLRRVSRRALAAAELTAERERVAGGVMARSEEERALARTRLTLHDNLDGTTGGHFTIPTFAGEILRKVIQQITSPRRRGCAVGVAPPSDEDHLTSIAAHLDADPGSTDAGPGARTNWSHRYGLALVEVLEHLPTDRLNGKVAATVVVTVDEQHLRDEVGVAGLDTGSTLSIGEVRRLACGAGILPAVLDTKGLPLDLGRTTRFFTEAQRVALTTLYDECAAEGCDRPYAWSELHHADPWSRGGRTDLRDAVPLCGFHHRRIHDPAFHHRIDGSPGSRRTVTFHHRT